jgi:hypothetical protein
LRVGDFTNAIVEVEAARLRGNVGRRIMQTEIGRLIPSSDLGDHLAHPVGGEAIDHHAVEADEFAYVFDGRLRDGEQVAAGLGDALRQPGEPCAGTFQRSL